MEHDLSLSITAVVVLGLAAQWVAWRSRLPAIVLLATAGLLAGPLAGLIRPSEDFGALLQPLVRLAVAIILFEGGLNLRLHELREAATAIKRLVTVGVLLAWVFGTLAAHYVAGLSWPVSLVLGAILVVTGPTVVIPMLRQARLARRPASLLKWEGIINDPLGALLAVLVFEFFAHGGSGASAAGVISGVAWAAAASAALGAGGGYAAGLAFARGYAPEFLKAPTLLGMGLLVYSMANLVQAEAGLLAATSSVWCWATSAWRAS